MYIVCGNDERILGLEEKPLVLFKQLDKEGKKPMFMLRKTEGLPYKNDPETQDPPRRGGGFLR